MGLRIHMKPVGQFNPRTLIRVGVLLACVGLLGCNVSSNPEAPPSGTWAARVSVAGHDEFNRAIPSMGPTEIVLTAKDRTLHAIIPQGKSSCIFTDLPYQRYVATGQQEGFYPALASSSDIGYDSLVVALDLFPHPSLAAKVDSIQYLLNTVVPRVRLRLYTAQTLPAGGERSAIIFAGMGADVSSRYGTYVFTLNGVVQTPGTSQILTDDFYRELHQAGITSGTRVYLTARLTTGATTSYADQSTGLSIFNNIEENTRVVTSFIMP
jgi:hypothetical protein